MTFLMVALGAGLGAAARFAVATWRGVGTGVMLVNWVGSFLLGLFSGLAISGSLLALLGTGFCGGLTTFSAFAVHTERLRSAPRAAAWYVVLTIGGSVLACWLGWLAASG